MIERRRSGTTAAVLLGAVLLVLVASCSLRQGNRATPGVSRPEGAPAAPSRKDSAQPAASFVANPFCKACHVDFDEEPLVLAHKAAGIGCERCHGESLRHRSDEANVTPPELMYPKERVNPTCMMCHPRHTIQQSETHRPILGANLSVLETPSTDDQSKKYCTDCHGAEHRMKVRAVRWDKYTGKQID